MQHQSNLFWKIPNIKIRIYYQFFSNFNKRCYQNRLFLKHKPWKMTNVVLFILMNFWYFPQFLPHFAALDLLRQIFHPQICRLPRQAANMTCIIKTIKTFSCGVVLGMHKASRLLYVLQEQGLRNLGLDQVVTITPEIKSKKRSLKCHGVTISNSHRGGKGRGVILNPPLL